MKKILDFIDNCLRKFFGIDKQEINPDLIKKNGNRLLLVNTESHKRHIYTQQLDQFLSKNINNLNDDTKQRLGISFGKILAKNLVVSFEKVTIKKEEKNV